MKSLLIKTLLICKKIIFVGIATSFSYLMANDFGLPNHDEVKKEVATLIELNRSKKLDETALQAIKRYASRSNGYIEITRESAPNIYKLIDSAANTIGIDIPLKIYLNKSHALTWNRCNAFVAKNRFGETYLSVGSKFLCELTEQEIKAVLEHEFMHIKDKFLEQLTSKIRKNGAVACSYLGLLGIQCVLLAYMSMAIYSQKYSNATLMALPIPFLSYLSGKLGTRILDNKTQLNNLCQELEQHADMNVSSKPDMASGLKKIVAMLTIETLKYNPGSIDKSVISIMENEMQDAIIENIEIGQFDSCDPLHPTLQTRLSYLKESTETIS